MTDKETLTLVDRFERCLLSPTEFHHRDHLAVAVTYLYQADFEAALQKMACSLRRFVAHHGGTRYHQTLTHFWMIQAEKHLDRSLCLRDSVDRVLKALPNKDVVHEYYSKERLGSPEAKESFVPPDLRAFQEVAQSLRSAAG